MTRATTRKLLSSGLSNHNVAVGDYQAIVEKATTDFRKVSAVMPAEKVSNLAYYLPLLLSLQGKPLTLENHFPFEAFFSSRMPPSTTWRCGRQVGKSISLAAQGILITASIPYFNTLFIAPLFETIRRFSTNYMATLINQSPVRRLFVTTNTRQNVLQRDFRNGSTMFFLFAYQNCDRVRGINSRRVGYDEAQDMDFDFIPLINQTMGGSESGDIQQHTGTPKTLNGTLERLWEDTSQAQWHIICSHCKHENIPSLEFDLEAMTGPAIVNRPISEKYPGVVCAKCGKPIYPRTGRWVHHRPELRGIREGRHVPQQIMPGHYADFRKWHTLLGKRAGAGNTSRTTYLNEVCGEGCDEGAKPVTQTDLKRACTRRPNSLEYAAKHIGDYVDTICAVDWGGGGLKRDSFTVLAILGLTADGRIDVLYGWRSHTPHDYPGEVREIIKAMHATKTGYLAHDYSGAGEGREHILIGAGFPPQQIIPISYIRAGKGALMRAIPENPDTGQRAYYQLDKARSLTLCFDLIRTKQIRFFEWDGGKDNGLIEDYLSLIEDLVETRTTGGVYTIVRDTKAGPDDFAQAVNYGACALFWRAGKWPNLADLHRIEMSAEQLASIVPPDIDISQYS